LFTGDLLDAQQNSVTMQRSKRQGFEDQQVKGALQKINLIVLIVAIAHSRRLSLRV
jgi:hypothetical protein